MACVAALLAVPSINATQKFARIAARSFRTVSVSGGP
jgi:hypothetical protein